VRQLRRRYDLLRHDYEQLLDRLGELEDRLNEASRPAAAPSALTESIAEAITAPLLKLREDYLSAVAGIQALVSGLEGLAHGFKGQHPARPAAGQTGPTPGPDIDEPPVKKMQIDVKGSGFGALLDFQERLSSLAGVSRVSISAIDNERATLVVELEQQQ
jgi:hypothetical protein